MDEDNVKIYTIGERIKKLKSIRNYQRKTLYFGLKEPLSWRGRYAELALTPVENQPVSDLIILLKGSIGTDFEGYKGGVFTMRATTPVNIDYWGEYTDGKLQNEYQPKVLESIRKIKDTEY